MIMGICDAEAYGPIWDLDASDEAHEEAITICRRCHSRAECHAEARSKRMVGVWGGRLFGKLQRSEIVEHGTETGAKWHQRRGELPCMPCLQARRTAGRRRYRESVVSA